MSKRMSESDALKIINSAKVFILSEYYSANNLINVKCKVCGNEWQTTVKRLKRSSCQPCSILRRTNARSMKIKIALEIIDAANAILLSEFQAASKKIKVRCKDCGHEWSSTVTLLRNSSCKPCSYKRNSAKRLRPIDEVIADLDKVGIDYIDDYRGANYPIKVKHRKCGHITENQKIHVLKKGFGCNTCWRVSEDDYVEYANRHGGKVLEIASSTRKKSKWLCKNGCEFRRSLSEMKLNDRFCNICSRQLSERLCKAVFEILFDVEFEKVKLPDLRGLKGGMLEFDLFNEGLKIAVEHQGSHHYRLRNKFDTAGRLTQQQKHDELKRQYCVERGIALFEIPELFYQTSLEDLPDTINEQALSFGIELKTDYRQLIAEIDPIGISTSDEMAFEALQSLASEIGYKLLEKKFRGGHAFHKFRCDQGHQFSLKSYAFLQGVRCGKCYELENRQPVFLSDGRAFKSVNEAARAIGVDSGSAHSALKRKHRVNEFVLIPISHEEYEALEQNEVLKPKLVKRAKKLEDSLGPTRVAVLLSDGRLFPSQMEASLELVGNPTAVGQALKRHNGGVAGLGVKVISDAEFERLLLNIDLIQDEVKKIWPNGFEERVNKKKRILLSDGRLFTSVSEAAKVMDVSVGAISSAIKRKGINARIKNVGIAVIPNERYLNCLNDPSALKVTLKEYWPLGVSTTNPLSKKVKSSTGEIYDAVKYAANAEGVSAGHMSNSIKAKKKINGKTFIYL